MYARALGKISEFIDEQDMPAINNFQNLVPAIVQVLQNCLRNGDDEGVSKIFEVFNDMLLLVLLKFSLLYFNFLGGPLALETFCRFDQIIFIYI